MARVRRAEVTRMTVAQRREGVRARARRREPWMARATPRAQSWQAFVLVGALLVGMLAALAGELAATQARARHTVEDRFADQVRTRAMLTNALFASSAEAARASNRKLYGTARVAPSTLASAADQSRSADAVLLARDGHLLASAPGTSATVLRSLLARPRFVREALSGGSFALSNVQSIRGRGKVVEVAVGFDTRYGRRVLVTGVSPTALAAIIGSYFVGTADTRRSRAYVIDARGTIVARMPASRASSAAAPTAPAGLLPAALEHGRGTYGAGGYFVASPIPGSEWRAVNTEPSAVLYATVSGFSKWIPWILFVALALMSSTALLLVGRLVRGVAAQRRVDERLRSAIDARLQLAAIVESTDDAIIGQTLGGRIISWNGGAEKLFGFKAAEIVGSSITTLLPSDRRHELAATMERINADRVDHRETVRLGRGGRMIDVALTISPVYNAAGELTGAATIARNITERKKIEADLVLARDQALEASRSKSDFVANMSHEIRTPLNGLVGMTDLLRDTPLDPVQREYLEALSTSSDALLSVINDILDFTKMEAGRLELDPVDFALRDAIEESCLMLSKQAHAKGLEINHWVDADVPVGVHGDRTRLRQVLLNLLANAVKFTDSGEVVLRVSCALEERVRFAVLDTGVGIDEARATSLFEAFVQADLSSSRRHGGTGLGLAISRQLVERMGGEIGARSREDGGSEFWFTAQLLPAQGPIAAPEPRPELVGQRALVVDSNSTKRTILEHYLTDWGLSCRSAELPSSALAELERAVATGHPFELAVLDYEMSEMNGIELARAIRSRPALGTVKVVLLTSAPVDRDMLAPAGIARVLTKPPRQSELCQVVADAIAGVDGAEAPAQAAKARSHPGGPIVLVAEDNEVNRAVAKALLAKRNLRTESAVNGKEALRMAQAYDYAAILMDCQMPELDGYEATRRIRELETRRHVPIIAMTAHSMSGDRERCLAAGMDDYLSKPVRANELDAAIERWIPGHKWGAPADVSADGADSLQDSNGARAQEPAEGQDTGDGAGVPGAEAPPAQDGAAAPPDGYASRAEREDAEAEAAGEILAAGTISELKGTLTDEMRAHLLAKFDESLPHSVAEIEEAVRDGDTVGLRRSAHMLRGSAATLGASRLKRVCARLERTRAGDRRVGEVELDELRGAVTQASEALRAELIGSLDGASQGHSRGASRTGSER
jgi:two-component system, sensor histidine kinase and response regulator